MAVTHDDVRHIARLARLGIADARLPAIVEQLNTILAHMDVLQKVNTLLTQRSTGVSSGGMPLRVDSGVPVPLARRIETFAPEMRDHLFIVPRLATHETSPDGGSPP